MDFIAFKEYSRHSRLGEWHEKILTVACYPPESFQIISLTSIRSNSPMFANDTYNLKYFNPTQISTAMFCNFAFFLKMIFRFADYYFTLILDRII